MPNDKENKHNTSSFPFSYYWNTSDVSEGNHTIKATAIDHEGEDASDNCMVKIISLQSCPGHPIVTDLDGNIKDILDLCKQGAIPVIHAHGDNIKKIEKFVPKFDYFLGSTQVNPTERVFLWGGFTDGDRACFLAAHYNPKQIIMVGMDFGNMVGRWSKPGHSSSYLASERKKIKLEIANELITYLKNNCSVEIDFFE